MKEIVIIGGVAGGASTAARLRRRDEESNITIYERGDYMSYANCGLPYYIGDEITDRDKLFVQTPEKFFNRFKVNVKTGTEVTAINRKKKQVEAKVLATGEIITKKYDKLVLSPGAYPLKPPIPGIDSQGIFTLRNVPDTDAIKEYIDQNNIEHAVVVGAGFIGLEMAENIHNLGKKVTIVEMSEQVMTMLDYEMAAEVHHHLKTKNVEFYLKDGVSSFSKKENGLMVTLNSGREINTDMVILSIGVRPDNNLAKDAGLKLGNTTGIKVNDYLQTNDPDIYAIGDAIEFNNQVTNKPMTAYLAGPANKQGRITADNIVDGNKHKYSGTIATAIAKVFDLTVASTGASEKLLKKEGIKYNCSITHSSSHAGYYPGATAMSTKICFDPENGKLLGAQIVGYEGVDKRIDLLAYTIKKAGNIYDLTEIEHAYAPPYSSAKDPVNMAGFVAQNIIEGKVKMTYWKDLEKENPEDIFILDVRTPAEFEVGSIDRAVNIEVDILRDNLNRVPKDKKIIIYCAIGLRAYIAYRILTQNGYDNLYDLSGGYKTYQHIIKKQSNEDIFEKDFIGNDDNIYQAAPDKSTCQSHTIKVDACGLQCPGPIIKLKQAVDSVNPGDRIEIEASDPGFYNDVKSWSNVTNNILVDLQSNKAKIMATIEKNIPTLANKNSSNVNANGATFVVFSQDLDKALASFVLANGAAASGKKVTLFFTFWGLNTIKKTKKPKVKKDIMGKMFGMMLPSSRLKLKLSKLNMLGMGTLMMRFRMKQVKVDSLENMIQQAIEAGVNLVACQMSMDVMGVKKEELLDEVKIGGVANYIESANESNLNLFI